MQNKTNQRNPLIIAGLAILLGLGVIGHCNKTNHDNKPGVRYYMYGEPVIERRFDTNEQLQEYLDSERGKQEAEYYSNLNQRE